MSAMQSFIEDTLREAGAAALSLAALAAGDREEGPVLFGLEENAAKIFPCIEVYPRPDG